MIPMPAKGQKITANWAQQLTGTVNGLAAGPAHSGVLVRDGAFGSGVEPLPQNPKATPAPASSTPQIPRPFDIESIIGRSVSIVRCWSARLGLVLVGQGSYSVSVSESAPLVAAVFANIQPAAYTTPTGTTLSLAAFADANALAAAAAANPANLYLPLYMFTVSDADDSASLACDMRGIPVLPPRLIRAADTNLDAIPSTSNPGNITLGVYYS